VRQERYALLAHYAVRTLMYTAACQAALDPDRLSFVAAGRLIQDAIPEFQQTAPAGHPRLLTRLLTALAAARLHTRGLLRLRRGGKRIGSKFQHKRPEHASWPQLAGPFRAAITLI
jgi:hypothetical protein